MNQVSYDKVKVGGFWQKRFEINKAATIPTVYKRFYETGRFDALSCNWKEEMPNRPHIFWDSDVAKWMEGVAYTLKITPDKELEALIDKYVDIIGENQLDDGYFNSYYISCELENRFTKRDNHELYCAGHLTEAAVAYYEATGKDKFLKIMCRYIDYIEQRFLVEDSAKFCTPGHEEIELALVRLYECTGEERYLNLSKYFVETRGTKEKDLGCRSWTGEDYDQSLVPVREQNSAYGHSVRATYLYCAMADLAEKTGDKTMFDACDRVFESMYRKRMYITGGIGSSAHGEKFADDYILPNDVAYSETCASIGLALFCRRMSALKPDAKYADVAEAAIYNCALAGVSLDGHAFFYVNPLEINIERYNAKRKFYNFNENLLTQRVEVFGCSCCPPNIVRFVPSIANFLYSYDNTTVYAHHFMESEAEFEGVKITQQTGYPFRGDVRFTVSGLKGRKFAVRIPGWCRFVSLNGEKLDADVKDGYAYLDVTDDEQIFDFWFEMKPRLVSSDPRIDGNNGRVCVCRGPIVYCGESVINDVADLNTLAITSIENAGMEVDEEANGYRIIVDGEEEIQSDELYRDYNPENVKKRKIILLPYYAYANHGESNMLVWFRVK